MLLYVRYFKGCQLYVVTIIPVPRIVQKNGRLIY